MTTRQQTKMILGLISGAILGIIAGIILAYGVGVFSEWETPNDPSAGSLAIIVILTAPGGAIIGAAFGAFVGPLLPDKSPQPINGSDD